jgi:hypothetical protein
MAITEAERWRWNFKKYPYEDADCGSCATMHLETDICDDRKHAKMREDAEKLPKMFAPDTTDESFRAAVLRFRNKWAKFYPARASE